MTEELARDGRLVTFLELPAMPKPRARVTRRGTYMPKEYREWKEDVGWSVRTAMRQQDIDPLTSRVYVKLDFSKNGFLLVLEESSLKRFGNADIDNLAGGVLDALQDADAIANDRDVVKLETMFVT